MSKLLLKTLREAPADTDSEGYALLVRAGYVRRLASGIYTFLPLGLKVLHKISDIVRAELDRADMQELLMPALSPIELWHQSGRSALFGNDALPALTVEGRGGIYVLGPTHEEVVTTTVGQEIESYRQLPVTVYQIQTKFRDEARPRYGLARTKELVMCDAYSFDVDASAMKESYERALSAYLAIFARVELDVTPVVAQSGAIGGDVNHEFMVPSLIGEDHFASCAACGYSANTEAATRHDQDEVPASLPLEAAREVPTPGAVSMQDAQVAIAGGALGLEVMLKSIAVTTASGEVAVISIPGDRDVRLPHGWNLLGDDALAAHPGLTKGSIGPQGFASFGIRVVLDQSVLARGGPWVAGANRADTHTTGLYVGRDIIADEVGSFVEVQTGDPCPICAGPLELIRSIEAAHTFQLGLTYTQKMPGSTYLDAQGVEQLMWMGCYGIGVSRLLGVLAEAHHDDKGLTWPSGVAPYQAHLVVLGAQRDPAVQVAADEIYAALVAAQIEVLYDDRDASPGVKFADADLLGVPMRLLVGGKGLARGVLEWRHRSNGTEGEIALDQVTSLFA